MSSGEQSPGEALIVGIDFGTTYSGVGWVCIRISEWSKALG